MAPSIAESSWESITEFVMKQGNGVKGLSDMGLQRLPKQYVQPLDERICMSTVVHDQAIPVIDMSNLDTDPKVADAICHAAQTWGFFQIVNHGLPPHVLRNVKDATYRFFELQAEEKMKYRKEYTGSNNVWFGTSFSPNAEKALEWKDYLSLFYVSEHEASALWPPQCKDQVLEYMKSSEIVIKRILETLMKRVNVEEIEEATVVCQLMGSKRVNLNYYPICPNPELTVGVGRHSDVSTLTFLLQDDIGGLYVRGRDDHSWIHVPPVPDSIVINVGDALQIMSNGRYKSIEHRVVANGARNRISVPIFVNPSPNDVIGPLPQLIAAGEKPIYRQVRYSDYVKHFFKKPHDGKNTIDFVAI